MNLANGTELEVLHKIQLNKLIVNNGNLPIYPVFISTYVMVWFNSVFTEMLSFVKKKKKGIMEGGTL